MKKRFALVGAAIGATLALLAGTALAYILVIGVGEATSTVHATKDLVVTVAPPVLVPGDRNQVVGLSVRNPNDRSVRVKEVSSLRVNDHGCQISASTTAQPNVEVGPGQSTSLTGLVVVSQSDRDERSCAYTLEVKLAGDLLGNG